VSQPVHLLLIEDDPAVARSLRDGLEREGYAVTWKTAGADGIQFAQAQNPQLIVLDVRLPDGSGFDFCRRMRELGLSQPILMLTVRGDETDKVIGLQMGADDYMTKPYSLRELVSRVRALLRRAYGELSSTDADVLYAGDLVIDRAARCGAARFANRSISRPSSSGCWFISRSIPARRFPGRKSSMRCGATPPTS